MKRELFLFFRQSFFPLILFDYRKRWPAVSYNFFFFVKETTGGPVVAPQSSISVFYRQNFLCRVYFWIGSFFPFFILLVSLLTIKSQKKNVIPLHLQNSTIFILYCDTSIACTDQKNNNNIIIIIIMRRRRYSSNRKIFYKRINDDVGRRERGGREGGKKKSVRLRFSTISVTHKSAHRALSLSHHFPYPLLYYIIAIFFFRLAFEMDDTVPIFIEIKPDIMFCGKV